MRREKSKAIRTIMENNFEGEKEEKDQNRSSWIKLRVI